jgi:acyl-CoA synthetase (AMP-forming)/AMP-acid ligase II
MLRVRAESTPDAPAVGFLADASADVATYASLYARARRVASLLRAHACRPGDRVLLLVPPGLDYIAAFFGCQLAGAVAVPSYPPRGGRALQKVGHVLVDSGARLVLLPKARDAAHLRDALPADRTAIFLDESTADDGAADVDPDAEAPAFLQYTSGSTSHPKGVILPHRAVLANLAQIAEAFGHSASSVGVNWLPPFHDMGLIGTILQPIFVGFPTYLMSPLAFVQRPARWLKAIGRHRATTVGAPSFAFELCADRVSDADLAAIDLSSVRVLFCGAEPIRADTLDRFVARFASRGLDPRAVYPCYGLAEATLFVTGVERGTGFRSRAAEGGARAYVSCGRPRAGTEVRVVDPERRIALPEGRVGEVWIRGPSIARGYWEQPEATEIIFGATLADAPGTRWLRTGDLAFLAEGELHPTGRIKDIIIVAGRKLASEEIERTALLALGCGADRAAVAFPVADAGGTEAVALVVELADLAGEGDPLAACEAWGRAVRDALAQEQDVGLAELHVVRRGDLLRTTSGKVERAATRRAFAEGACPVAATWRAGLWSLGDAGFGSKRGASTKAGTR